MNRKEASSYAGDRGDHHPWAGGPSPTRPTIGTGSAMGARGSITREKESMIPVRNAACAHRRAQGEASGTETK